METNKAYTVNRKTPIHVEQLTIEELYRSLVKGFEELDLSNLPSKKQEYRYSQNKYLL